jgi:small conductance mechanosensitive channel
VSAELLVLEVLLLIVLPAAVGLWLSKWLGSHMRHRGASPLFVRLLRILITVIWAVIVVYGFTVAFGPFSFLSALTVSAVATIAVTLALQTTLQNIIAGFILLREGFLRMGDTIQFSSQKGTVVSIGLVSVIVRLESGTLATVSNANLLSGPLLNFTATSRLAEDY